MDFSVVEKAGLTYTNLADIMGVSKGRVSQWKQVPPAPLSAQYDRLNRVLNILSKAVANGKLPVGNMNRAKRDVVAEKIKEKLAG